jgi:hypothetical protein
MEVTFKELDNTDNYNTSYYNNLISKTNIQDSKNYYPKQIINTKKNTDKPKRNIVSYDDILSSMNTVVIDGKLEFIRKDRLHNTVPVQNSGTSSQENKKKVTFNQFQTQNNNQPPIDKNSYIYNKFFKDYKDPNNIQNKEPRRPLTKNELIKMLIINQVNAINARNRIAEIKSTKLLFNNNNNHNIVINPRSVRNINEMNHLFIPLKI